MNEMFSQAMLSVGINTSALIDSVIADTPTAIYEVVQFAQTQKQASHYAPIRDSGACYIVQNDDEFDSLIRTLKTDGDSKSGLRDEFTKKYIFPATPRGLAGKYIADCICEQLKSNCAR